MKINYQIDINAPVEKVFENITQPEKFKQWMKSLKKFEYTGTVNTENPVGTKYKQVTISSRGDQYFDGEITEYKKNEKISIRLHNFKVTSTATYYLAPSGNGTHLTFEGEMRIHFFIARFIASLMSDSIKGMIRGETDQLKIFSEK